MENQFKKWLIGQLEARSWRASDLAHAANLGSGTLSNVLSGKRKPGPDICLAIAEALDYSPVYVFRQAEILPPAPDEHLDDLSEQEVELIELFRQAAPVGREYYLRMLRGAVETERQARLQRQQEQS